MADWLDVDLEAEVVQLLEMPSDRTRKIAARAPAQFSSAVAPACRRGVSSVSAATGRATFSPKGRRRRLTTTARAPSKIAEDDEFTPRST